MTTTIILVRHAEHDLLCRVLIGRQPDVILNSAGMAQATRLGPALARRGARLVMSSSQARALQTARPFARLLGKAIEIAREFDDIEYGDWSGLPFDQLRE